jgi:hypothetical protein
MQKESHNGGAKRWLTCCEWASIAYLGDGENGEMGGSFPQWVVFKGGGEREVRGGPLGSALDVGIEPDRRASGMHRVPLPQVTDMWAAVQILRVV